MTNRLQTVSTQRARRTNRVRSRIHGTADRPRLHVHISNQHVSAQVIDDDKSATICATSTVGKKSAPANMTEKAAWVGKDIAKKAATKKVTKVVLDRGGKLYHGRVKALADAAREAGLEL